MYKNVQVNQYNNATNTSTTSSSSFSSHTNPKNTSLPVQITSAFSPSLSNSNIGDSGISLPVSYKTSDEIMSSSTKFKSDVDQLDDLVKDLLSEVNRPVSSIHRYSYQRPSNDDLSTSKLSSSSTNPQRTKTTREERIRIKRGVGSGTEIPVTTSSSSMTTTTTTATKPQVSSSTVDEHLIDSLLESVQNTLKKRTQRNQSNWTTDIPIQNRRTYSSSAAYNDSVHRVSSFILII
jgi:hypothetical protein